MKKGFFTLFGCSALAFATFDDMTDYSDQSSGMMLSSTNCPCEKDVIGSDVLKYATHTTNPNTGKSKCFRFEAEYLIMQAMVNTPVVSKATGNITSTPETYTFQDLDYNFAWESGLRAFLGFSFDSQDKWDIAVVYTYEQGAGVLNYTLSNFTSSVDNDSFKELVFPAAAYSDGTNTGNKAYNIWGLHYQSADGFLGRNFAFSKTLSFHPFLGIRGIFISETARYNNNMYYSDFNGLGAFQPSRLYLHLNARGVGLRPGIDALWSFGKHGGIYGNLSTTLATVRTKYSLKTKNYYITGSSPNETWVGTKAVKNFNRRIIAANIETGIGLQFDFPMDYNRVFFSIKMGYEYIYWTELNVFNFTDTFATVSPLTMQGGEVGFSISY